MIAQTSDRVSSLAANYIDLTPERLLALTSTGEHREEIARDIRRMAASLLRQDEVKGVRRLLKLVTG